jgi:5-methyltetrahydrofolate--homocysteine methyltransferase
MSLERIYQGIIEGDKDEVIDSLTLALSEKTSAENILNRACIPAMDEVGRRFENGDFFVPEMLIAARAMQAGMEIIKPMLAESGVEAIGKVLLCTVQGDLHDIGKNLVGIMLEGAGFEVTDLGTDVGVEEIVAHVEENQIEVVALSALLTTTMSNMKSVLVALESSGLREKVKVMVGGAPVTAEYAEEIKADGYAPDASQAANLAKSFLN